MKLRIFTYCLWLVLFSFVARAAQDAVEIKDPSVSGGVSDGRVRLVIEGLSGHPGDKDKLQYSVATVHFVQVSRERIAQNMGVTFYIVQGEPKELTLTINGEGDIRDVTGGGLQDWEFARSPAAGAH